MRNEYICKVQLLRMRKGLRIQTNIRKWRASHCVLAGDNDAADCFRDCIDLLDSIPAADVEIMLSQLKIIFGDWSDWKHYKMDRLEERINAINGTKENDC